VQPDFDFNNSNWTRQNNQNADGTGVGSSAASFLLGLPNSGNVPVNAQSYAAAWGVSRRPATLPAGKTASAAPLCRSLPKTTICRPMTR
jgi:hypothetical protein